MLDENAKQKQEENGLLEKKPVLTHAQHIAYLQNLMPNPTFYTEQETQTTQNSQTSQTARNKHNEHDTYTPHTHNDTDVLILNEDVFTKFTKNQSSKKEDSTFMDALLADALAPTSASASFQNHEGIFIPHSARSKRKKRASHLAKGLHEHLQAISIVADNFTHTPLRDIDFSDIHEKKENSSLENHEHGALQSITNDNTHANTQNIRANTAHTDYTSPNASSPDIFSPDVFSPDIFSPDIFSMDKIFKVETVYAMTFDDDFEQEHASDIIKTSFFDMYEKTDISLEDTPMWDSVHDTFFLQYQILRQAKIKSLTENYGINKSLVESEASKQRARNILNSITGDTHPNRDIKNNTEKSLLLERSTPPSFDTLCQKSPELIDIAFFDACFNDPITCPENVAIFEDFNPKTDLIDLTGYLGTNYTFEIAYEKNGFLICIKNEKDVFIQCFPVALTNPNHCIEHSALQKRVQETQAQILGFGDTPHSVLSTSLRAGQNWFTKATNFEDFNPFDVVHNLKKDI